MEDGREIFDDDLDDDVVENNKGKHSYNITLHNFFLYFECKNLSKLFLNSFAQRVISFVKMFCSQGKQVLKEQTPRKM